MAVASNIRYQLLLGTLQGQAKIPDPGDGKQIKVDKDFGVCLLTIGSGSETRTLPDPSTSSSDMGIGTSLLIVADQISGGDCTIEGVSFNVEGEAVRFTVVQYNGTKQWINDQAQIGGLDLNGGRLTIDADADSYIEEVADDVLALALGGSQRVRFNASGGAIEVLTGQHMKNSGHTHYLNQSATGATIERIGSSTTEGLELKVYEDTISPSAIETNLLQIPANSVIVSVQSNVEVALTGGGTTDSYGIGTAGDPDKYGSSATLTQNSKTDFIPAWTFLTSAEQLVLTGTASETADGDTALTVGDVRVRVVYYTLNSLDNAA